MALILNNSQVTITNIILPASNKDIFIPEWCTEIKGYPGGFSVGGKAGYDTLEGHKFLKRLEAYGVKSSLS